MTKSYSSDTRVILATSFPVFREIVLEYCKPTTTNQLMFDQEQIDQTYLSPHHTFLRKDIAEVGVDIIVLRKKTFQLRMQLLQQENVIKETAERLQRKHDSDPKKIAAMEKKLKTEYEKTEDSLQTLNTLLNSALQKLSGTFDNLMSKHDQEWRDHRKKFTDKLIEILEDKNMLFENEKQRLLKQESIIEILGEFQGRLALLLSIDTDDIHKKSSNLFSILIDWVAYATLSRRMTAGEITPQMIADFKKQLNFLLEEIDKDAGGTTGKQDKERKALAKEVSHGYETLRQLFVQFESQNISINDILEVLESILGIRAKELLKNAEEKAAEEEFEEEIREKEGLRYG